MSTTIDNRVVQMTMDNKKFESGANNTLSTLDKLKRALNFDDVGKEFDKIQDSADSLTLGHIASSIDSISERFSGLGIVGMTIWQHIGDAAWDFVTGALSKVSQGIDSVTSQIKSGGWQRALNLEQASFMINNLGYAWDEYSENFKAGMNTVKDSVSAAVDGTAYSLDEAAVSAASFLAAGVQGGEELTDTLRSVMGVASTYSKDFSVIARVMQNVAARGFVMYGDVSDLQANGVAAADVLKEYLGLTGDELEEAYKDHLIDFETFRDAFLDKFGDSLDKANDTYTGSLSNLKSALSRIGAEVATPLLEELVPLLNQLRIFVNDIKSALVDTGAFNVINSIVKTAVEGITSFIGGVEEVTDENGKVTKKLVTNANLLTVIKNIIDGITGGVMALSTIVGYIATAFKNVFGSGNGNLMVSFSEKFRDLMWDISENRLNHDKFIKVFETLFKILKGGVSVLKTIVSTATPFIKSLVSFGAGIIKTVVNVIDFNKVIQFFGVSFEIAKNTIAAGWSILKDIFGSFKDKLDEINQRTHIFDGIKTVFATAFDAIGFAVDGVVKKFKEFTGINFEIPSMEDMKTNILDFFSNIKTKAGEAKDKLIELINNPKDALELAKGSITGALEVIRQKFAALLEIANEKFGTFVDWISQFKDGLFGAKESVVEFADSSEENLNGATKTFSIFDTLKAGLEKLSGVLGTIKEFAVSVGSGIFNILAKVFENVKEVLGDMTWEDVFNILKTAIAFVIAIDFDTLITKITTFVNNLNTVLAPIQKQSTKAKSTFKILGDMALKFGIAVILFAYAIGMLNDMDVERTKQTVATIGEIISIFTGAFILMNKFLANSSSVNEKMDKAGENNFIYSLTKNTTNYNTGAVSDFGKAMIEMAASIYIIAKAMEQLKDIDIDKLAPIMATFAGGLAELILAIFGAGKLLTGMSSEFIKSMAFAMIELGVAIYIISKSVQALGSINPDSFDQGLIGLTSIVGLMAAFVAVNDLLGKTNSGGSAPSFVAIGFSMILLAAAVDLMLPAILILGKISPETFNQGLIGITAIMGLFAAMAIIIGVVTKFSSKAMLGLILAATSFIEIALALDALVPAIVVLGMLQPEQLVQGVAALTVIMGMFTILAGVAGTASTATGVAAIIAIAIAVGVCVPQLIKLSQVDGDALKRAMIALAASVILFVGAALVVKKAKLGNSLLTLAASMLIISIALVPFVGAIKMLASIKGKDLAKSIIAMAAALAVMIAAAAVIKYLGLGLTLAELAVSTLAFGAAAFLIAAGLTLFCIALTLIGPSAALAIAGVSLIFEAITDLADNLSESLDAIVNAVETLAKDLIMILLAAIIGALEGLEESLGELIDKVVNIVILIFEGLTARMGDIVVAVFDFVVALIYEVGNYLETHDQEILDALESLLVGLATVATGLWDRFKGFGEDICWGILEGMSQFEWYNKLIDWVGDHIIGPICDFLGIHSPSTTMRDKVGDPIAKGLWNGIKNFGKTIFKNITGWVKDHIIGPIVNKFSDIKEKGKTLVNNLKEGMHNKMETVKNKATEIVGGIKKKLEDGGIDIHNIGGSLMEKLHEGMDGKFEWLKGKVGDIWGGIKGVFDDAGTFFGEIGDKIKGLWSDDTTTALDEATEKYLATQQAYEDAKAQAAAAEAAGKDVGNKFGAGFAGGIITEETYVNESARQLARGAVDASGKAIKVNSPSRVMREMGGYFSEGFGLGIIDGSKSVEDTALDLMTEVINLFNDPNLDVAPTITPVLDMSEIQNRGGEISRLIGSDQLQFAANMDISTTAKRNSDFMDKMHEYLEEFKLTSSTQALEEKISAQNDIIAGLSSKLDNLSVYLDSGAVVGGIVNKMDKALGFRAGLVGRSAKA